MRWQSGQSRIDDMLAAGELERCSGSPRDARLLLGDAEQYLARLKSPDTTDDALRYRFAFRAMAASAGALLAAQGLRHTSAGGLVAVQRAIDAQFGAGPGPGVFDALTRLSVPPAAGASITERANEAADLASWAVAFATRVLAASILHPFRDELATTEHPSRSQSPDEQGAALTDESRR